MGFPDNKHYRCVLTLPVKNEEVILGQSVNAAWLVAEKMLPEPWLIIIAVNDSQDETLPIAKRLADELPNVAVYELSEDGKGRAIRQSWESVVADYYFFSDVDLSVDLSEALPKMLQALQEGADIVTGSRVLPESVVRRPLYRKIFSAGYRWLARLMTGTRLTDLPCGCKGVTRRIVQELLPKVKDNEWFFDSELLLLGERLGFNIKEISIVWIEYRFHDRVRKINLLSAVYHYLIAIIYLRHRLELLKKFS